MTNVRIESGHIFAAWLMHFSQQGWAPDQAFKVALDNTRQALAWLKRQGVETDEDPPPAPTPPPQPQPQPQPVQDARNAAVAEPAAVPAPQAPTLTDVLVDDWRRVRDTIKAGPQAPPASEAAMMKLELLKMKAELARMARMQSAPQASQAQPSGGNAAVGGRKLSQAEMQARLEAALAPRLGAGPQGGPQPPAPQEVVQNNDPNYIPSWLG
jgi:hypothetical protein